jgi:hypothetical protein
VFARALGIAYTLAAVVVVLGTAAWVAVRDATPALLIPGVFGGLGIFLVGEGVRAVLRGTTLVRTTAVERSSNALFFWVLVAGHFAFGGWAIWFAIQMFTLPTS